MAERDQKAATPFRVGSAQPRTQGSSFLATLGLSGGIPLGFKGSPPSSWNIPPNPKVLELQVLSIRAKKKSRYPSGSSGDEVFYALTFRRSEASRSQTYSNGTISTSQQAGLLCQPILQTAHLTADDWSVLREKRSKISVGLFDILKNEGAVAGGGDPGDGKSFITSEKGTIGG